MFEDHLMKRGNTMLRGNIHGKQRQKAGYKTVDILRSNFYSYICNKKFEENILSTHSCL